MCADAKHEANPASTPAAGCACGPAQGAAQSALDDRAAESSITLLEPLTFEQDQEMKREMWAAASEYFKGIEFRSSFDPEYEAAFHAKQTI